MTSFFFKKLYETTGDTVYLDRVNLLMDLFGQVCRKENLGATGAANAFAVVDQVRWNIL